jgi:hypothetical protein
MTYRVAIVVERDFGKDLVPLARRVHVWACYTTENRLYVDEARRALPNPSIEHGVTTFNVRPDESSEEMLLGILETVDLHHGEHSHSPPWSTLEVYGALATHRVRAALAEFGVDSFSPTDKGFHCSRPETSARRHP